MTPHQLVGDGARHVGERKRPLSAAISAWNSDLQQHVAELVAERRRVALVDGVEHLVGLLDEVRAQALVRLLAIPRTAARGAQARHDVDQAAAGSRASRHRPSAPG